MYPFASLPENLAAFCETLRRHHHFRIGLGELHDAARALDIVDLADERAVRNALRPVLSGTLDEVSVFNGAFTKFFFPRPRPRLSRLFSRTRCPPRGESPGRTPPAAKRTPSVRAILRYRTLTRTKRPGWKAVR